MQSARSSRTRPRSRRTLSGASLAFLLVLVVGPAAAAVTWPDLPALPAAPVPAHEPPVPQRDDGDYLIRFACVEQEEAVADTAGTCPAYVLDREDIFGQPVLLVDPLDPELVAFSAMHGGRGLQAVPGSDPPSQRSRSNAVHQPHTTFRTTDAGAAWQDMPYYAPDALAAEGREVFGEDNAAVLDGEGRVHLASLYAYRQAGAVGGAPEPAQYAVGTWKAHRIERPVDYFVNTKVLEAEPGAVVDSIHLAYAAPTDVVVLLWREANEGATPLVRAHRSAASEGAAWHGVEAPVAEGCGAITNPIVVGAEVFFACRARAANGTAWRVHALDTATWTSRLAGEAPLDEPYGLLVARGSDGFMALIGSGLAADNRSASVRIAYGEAGARWSVGENLAPQLSRAAGVAPLSDARVTAAAYAPRSGNLHIVFMERLDLARTGSPRTDRPEFSKVFAAVQAEGSFQGLVDLQLGRIPRPDLAPTTTGVGTDVYSDLHDSIVVVTTPAGEEREFLAFGDYGWVRFAEVEEEGFLPPIPALAAQAPAIPAASGTAAPVVVGVVAGTLSSAMVARTLMARRKHAAEAPSE